MQRYTKIKDHSNFVRDEQSGAILNIDTTVAERHKARVANLNKEAQQAQDIENLKKDVEDIKDMLLQILSSLKNKE